MIATHSCIEGARRVKVVMSKLFLRGAQVLAELNITVDQGRIKAGADGAAAPGPPKNRPTTIPSQRSLKSYSYDHFQKIVKV